MGLRPASRRRPARRFGRRDYPVDIPLLLSMRRIESTSLTKMRRRLLFDPQESSRSWRRVNWNVNGFSQLQRLTATRSSSGLKRIFTGSKNRRLRRTDLDRPDSETPCRVRGGREIRGNTLRVSTVIAVLAGFLVPFETRLHSSDQGGISSPDFSQGDASFRGCRRSPEVVGTRVGRAQRIEDSVISKYGQASCLFGE